MKVVNVLKWKWIYLNSILIFQSLMNGFEVCSIFIASLQIITNSNRFNAMICVPKQYFHQVVSRFFFHKFRWTMLFCYQNFSNLLWEEIVLVVEKNFLRYGCQQLTRFGVFQDRIMKLSGWAWFMISWSLSKFELI